ncbi:MAG: hypothetical protein K2J67_01955, partial [Lachnospiraceae bacterium]|nr:hypothetical protein [Lachnospiraceae bacterium]
MKQLIAQQVQFILLMTMSGMSLMAGYDVLRLIRWLFPHGQISIAIEDILYWIAVSVPVFYLFLEFHDGIIRWYGLVAVFSGIVLYEYGLSRPVRNKIAAFFNRIRKKWRKRRERIREMRRQKRQKKLEIDQEKRRQRREKMEREKQQRLQQKEVKKRQRQEQMERDERKRQQQREE